MGLNDRVVPLTNETVALILFVDDDELIERNFCAQS